MLKEEFAKKLKNIRKSRKFTQEKLAELVNVDFRYISILENAKSFPSSELIEKLTKALNVSYAELFDFEEDLSREEIIKNITDILPTINNGNIKILYDIAKKLV